MRDRRRTESVAKASLVYNPCVVFGHTRQMSEIQTKLFINVTQRWWNKIITHHQHISNGYTLFIFTYYSLSNCLFSVSLFVFYFNFVLRLLLAWFSLSLSLFSFLSSFLPFFCSVCLFLSLPLLLKIQDHLFKPHLFISLSRPSLMRSKRISKSQEVVIRHQSI